MIQPDCVTDFVQGHTKPSTTVLALTPVRVRIHDRKRPCGCEARGGVWWHCWCEGSQVACDHLNAAAG